MIGRIEQTQSNAHVNVEKDLLLEAKRNAEEATQIGRETLTELGKQNETLNATEDTIESNQFILNRSLRILRFATYVYYTIASLLIDL